MKFVVIDRCPVPAEIAPQVQLLKKAVPGAQLQSAYRGDLATGLLKRLGKSTQAMLYYGWLHRLPGYNPANPPGRSTHELRSDGVAYRGPVGRAIKPWGCGLDFNDAQTTALIAAAKKRGWELFRPYPSGSEYHHLNFRHFPTMAAAPKPRQARKAAPARPSHATHAGVQFIAGFEGFRSKPYQDVVGVWTIGYGHTAGVSAHSTPLTPDQGAQLLHEDLKTYEKAVHDNVKVPLTPLQFDALVSFTYNLGVGAFLGSTLLRELNKKHYAAAANEFPKWDRAGGHELAGLKRRRLAERAMFLKGSSAGARAKAGVIR